VQNPLVCDAQRELTGRGFLEEYASIPLRQPWRTVVQRCASATQRPDCLTRLEI